MISTIRRLQFTETNHPGYQQIDLYVRRQKEKNVVAAETETGGAGRNSWDDSGYANICIYVFPPSQIK